MIPVRRLHLDGQPLAAPLKEQVDLDLRPVRRPVEHLVEDLRLPRLGMGAQRRHHPAFEQRPAFLRRHLPELALHGPDHARVHPVQLRALALPHPQPGFVGGQAMDEQRIFQDVEVALHRGAGDPRLAGDPGHVDDLPVEQRRDGEEADESGQVAHQRLGADLLPQIELRIRFEDVARRLARPHERDRAVAQHPVEIERGAELGRGERKHAPMERPSGEQVHPRRLELARAGAEEGEAQAPRLDEAVDLVQQRRQPLDLVHDHPAVRPRIADGLCEQRRIREQVLIQPLVEEVHVHGLRKGRSRPGALADAPHSKEEEAPRGRREQAVIDGGHVVMKRRKMTAYYTCRSRAASRRAHASWGLPRLDGAGAAL